MSQNKNWADISDEVEDVTQKMHSTSIPKEEPKDQDDALYIPKEDLQTKDRKTKVVVLGEDSNSPLMSAKSFEDLGLSEEIKKGVYAQGFKKPSKIQEKALPIILSKKNLIAQAQSGTGKTAAFALGILSHCDKKLPTPQALVLCPARELARQLADVIRDIGKFSGIEIQLIVPDLDLPKKVTAQIIVATPGKILECFKTKVVDFKSIGMLVLDEADQMIEKGSQLGNQSQQIKNILSKSKPQILFFSATFAEPVRKYAESIVPKPCLTILLQPKELTVEGIQQFKIRCKDENDKFNVLSDIYGYLTVGQSIIFVHKRETAEQLTQKMKQKGHTVTMLHGKIGSQERDKVMDDFKNGKTKVLISTNVLARGIDILQVMLVINYDIPLDAENKPDPQTYLHRIGRSGRFGRKGLAINFVHDERSSKNLDHISKYLQKEIAEYPKEKIEELQTKIKQLQSEEQKLAEQRSSGLIDSDSDDDPKSSSKNSHHK